MGLPQGQELSPILFALFIADYCPNTNGEDDVGILDCMGNLILIRAIFSSGSFVFLASGRAKLLELTQNFRKYCEDNELTNNYNKTKDVIFIRARFHRLLWKKSQFVNSA